MATNYYTADQMLRAFALWGIEEPLPSKGMAVWANFPGKAPNLGVVTRSEHKSTYGKTLYALEWK
jgi:hypothetical protein